MCYVQDLKESKTAKKSNKSRINVKCVILSGKLDFRMLQKFAAVTHSIENYFEWPQIPSIELRKVFKRIICLCTCCDGRVLIY